MLYNRLLRTQQLVSPRTILRIVHIGNNALSVVVVTSITVQIDAHPSLSPLDNSDERVRGAQVQRL